MIKILELFGGIGACTQAFKRLGIPYEIADYVEIDKYAVKSYNAINGSDFEPQDICKWDKDIAVDFIMHGSPCQDFSIAGKQAGGDEGSGTRSSLLYETLRIVEKTRPKYVLWENVRNLMSARHKPNWEKYCQRMEELGYRSVAKILNAKDYGIPQNRERVYTMSIRNDITGDFKFPDPEPLEKKLKDVLEDEVDEKYYLTDAQVASFKASTKKAEAKGNGFKFEPLERERESSPHSSDESREQTDRQLYSGVIGKVDAINGHDILKRVYGTDGVSPTLSTMGGGNTEPKIVASRGKRQPGMPRRNKDPQAHAKGMLALDGLS